MPYVRTLCFHGLYKGKVSSNESEVDVICKSGHTAF